MTRRKWTKLRRRHYDTYGQYLPWEKIPDASLRPLIKASKPRVERMVMAGLVFVACGGRKEDWPGDTY